MANVYWFGGTGNWSDAAHWSNNSGNSPASLHGAEPGTDDDVVFDTLSNATAYTVTVDSAAGTRACKNLTMGAPLAGKVTWAGTAALGVYGDFNLSGGTAGITKTYVGAITFKQLTGVQLITTNSVPILSTLVFNDADTTFRLVDNLTTSGAFLTLTAGTFDATTNSRAVILTSNDHLITGAFTFYDLTRTGTTTFNDLRIASNIVVTHALVINGNSALNRMFVRSNTIGTAKGITTSGASVTITNADFRDIAVTDTGGNWALTGIAGGSGDCGGNSGINFTAADEWYWYKNTGNFTSTTLWFTGSGGTGTRIDSDARNAKVILPQDTCYFDASSFDAGSQTITQGMPRIGSVIWTGATNTPTFTTNQVCSVFGSMTLISGMTLTASTQAYTYEGRGEYTLDSGGLTWNKHLFLMAPGGKLTLKSDYTSSGAYYIAIQNGEFSAVDGVNNYNVTTSLISSNVATTRAITMGSGTWTLTGDSTFLSWANITGMTFDCGTSTLKLTGTLTASRFFTGQNQTFYNFWNATTGAYEVIVDGSNTFADFKIDAGREVNFTNSTTQTVTTFTALGTSGSHIVIHNTSSTTHATLTKAGGGVITGCDYIDIQEITGSPATTWYIGPNSTDVGTTCTEIYLSNAPAGGTVAPLCNLSLLGVS